VWLLPEVELSNTPNSVLALAVVIIGKTENGPKTREEEPKRNVTPDVWLQAGKHYTIVF
jgi:hypothetical protein